jgi:hypothetical protein
MVVGGVCARRVAGPVLLGLALLLPGAAMAQAIKAEPAPRVFSEAEIAAVEMPKLDYAQTPEIAADFDKYFFFHRPDTSFAEAFEDISRCDAMAAGISYSANADSTAAMAQYGVLAGALGGAIGNAIGDAIFGSAERRRIRRINMRNCMGFKGYLRYGMERELWQAFHFEEGNGRVTGDERTGYLLKQARVAAGPVPALKVLQP